ncbi:tRNA pseudouridine(38-40) synthase TruA [Halovivax gelatinilyticus]|uniref:tRNA pseudouridine(38-40) synthase TruA n=1 Tax=Halovivax gelatinilyticus TaxID=2961597 RepID=UPI0020CA9C0F|nr:tRNA pseudouridine(38-40) synthase TruA [Halovivax gelatinilyticus]
MRAFRLAYDGAGYAGFQRQPDVDTVEGTMFDTLRALSAYRPEPATATPGDDRPDRPRGYAAAGRTDAGVSAIAQTVAFSAPEWLTPRAMNAELPADIRAWASADVPTDFHATHDATERTYTYHLYAPARERETVADSYPDWPAVSDERVREACRALSGTNDYHNLTPDETNTERTIEIAAARDGPFVELTVTAGGFARQLVRRLVTLIRRVGSGESSLETIDRVLDREPLPGHEGVPPAAPEPLVLADVTYPNVGFDVDAEAAASARTVFEQRRIERATGTRVSRQLRDGVR